LVLWLDDMHINDTSLSGSGIRFGFESDADADGHGAHCTLVCTNIFIKIGKVYVCPTAWQD